MCMEMNMQKKKNIKISLNDHNFPQLFFPQKNRVKMDKWIKKQLVNQRSFIFLDTIVHIILDCQRVPYNPQQSGSFFVQWNDSVLL